MIVDQLSDPSFKVMYKIATTSISPELEKVIRTINVVVDVDSESKGTLTKLASSLFADEHERRFPINSKDNVILSKVYFDYQKSSMEPKLAQIIERKIDTHLDLYGVPESLFIAPESLTKIATEESKAQNTIISETYLLPEHNIGKVCDKSDLEKLGSDFEQNHMNLDMSDRVQFAQNFVKYASEFVDIKYPQAVAKYASLLDTDLANTTYLLKLRAGLSHKKGMDSTPYTKLAGLLDEVVTNNGCFADKSSGLVDVTCKKSLVKLAETIQNLDEVSGLADRKYDNLIPDSFSSVFNKSAESADSLDGTDSTVNEKTPTKAEVIALYGEDVLEEVEDEDGNIDLKKFKEVEKLIKQK